MKATFSMDTMKKLDLLMSKLSKRVSDGKRVGTQSNATVLVVEAPLQTAEKPSAPHPFYKPSVHDGKEENNENNTQIIQNNTHMIQVKNSEFVTKKVQMNDKPQVITNAHHEELSDDDVELNTNWISSRRAPRYNYKSILEQRYCNGSLTFWMLVLLFLLSCFLIIAIIIPVTTYFLLPNQIQTSFDSAMRSMQLSMTSPLPLKDGNNININFTMAAASPIYGLVDLLNGFTLNLSDSKSANSSTTPTFASIHLSRFQFAINANTPLALNGLFTISNPAGLTKLASMGNDSQLLISTTWNVQVDGLFSYKELPLSSKLDLSAPASKQLLKIASIVVSGAKASLAPSMHSSSTPSSSSTTASSSDRKILSKNLLKPPYSTRSKQLERRRNAKSFLRHTF